MAIEPGHAIVPRQALQQVLARGGVQRELGVQGMVRLPNGDHGVPWTKADALVQSVTGRSDLLDQHFGARALESSVSITAAAHPAHAAHGTFREVMSGTRAGLFERLADGSFGLHVTPAGIAGPSTAAGGARELTALGAGEGATAARTGSRLVRSLGVGAAVVGVGVAGFAAWRALGEPAAAPAVSVANTEGSAATTTSKQAVTDERSRTAADDERTKLDDAGRELDLARPTEKATAESDHVELSADEVKTQVAQLQLAVDADPASEDGKRAQIAIRALGETGRGIVTTKADGSVTGEAAAYMGASGAEAKADREWSGDFVAWASAPVHKIGFDGGGFRNYDDTIAWLGAGNGLTQILRTDHVADEHSDEAGSHAPALPKVGDMLALNQFGDDMELDSFGVVTSVDGGTITSVIGNGVREDGTRGIVTRTMNQDDPRLIGFSDAISAKDVSRPKPPPPPPPPAPAAPAGPKSRPHLSGDIDNPGSEDFERMLDKLEQLGVNTGWHIIVRSGMRTNEEQAVLRAAWERDPKHNPYALKPGESQHNFGRAADVGVGTSGDGVALYNVKGSSAAAEAVGLKFTALGKGEPWHVEG